MPPRTRTDGRGSLSQILAQPAETPFERLSDVTDFPVGLFLRVREVCSALVHLAFPSAEVIRQLGSLEAGEHAHVKVVIEHFLIPLEESIEQHSAVDEKAFEHRAPDRTVGRVLPQPLRQPLKHLPSVLYGREEPVPIGVAQRLRRLAHRRFRFYLRHVVTPVQCRPMPRAFHRAGASSFSASETGTASVRHGTPERAPGGSRCGSTPRP